MPDQPYARFGLAIVRLTIGAMLVWVFFENLGKGLYTPAGYAGLINYYIQHDHAPAVWKTVMALAASHASMAAPLQALTEISLGVLLVLGLLTRPVGLAAVRVAQAVSGSLSGAPRGSGNCWSRCSHRLRLRSGRAGRTWGVDALLARRWPSSPWW